MDRSNIVVGGIALVAGILLGFLFAPSGASVEEIETALEDRFVAVEQAAAGAGDNAAAAVQPLMQGMDERLASVETAVADAGTATTDSMGAMRSELSETLSSLGSSVSNLESSVADLETSLSEQTDTLSSQMSGLGSSVAEKVATQLPEMQPTEGSSGEGSGGMAARLVASEAGADFVGIGAGETEVFGDGALRAFVSRVDADAGEVRMSVNGETMTMLVGDAVNVTAEDGTYCRLMVSGLQGRQVALNAGCGDELAAPEGARPGNVSLLADGAVRVFVSGIARDGGTARIAVNGTETESVAVGDSVEVETENGSCQVTVDGIDRGHVAVSANCG